MAQIPRKANNRPAINFYGFDGGSWFETDEYLLSPHQYDWSMISGLTAKHNGNIYHVEGATEAHPGFQKALIEITDKYSEIVNYYLEFDGPPIQIKEILNQPTDISQITFLHGTTTALWPQIQQQGLQPRSVTGLPATYGHQSSAKPGQPDAIYLTTQINMAKFAARDAVKLHGGEPLILQISDINPEHAIADIDSGAITAEESLYTLGSIGYLVPISPTNISTYRSNPDEPHRRYERAYQADPSLEHLVAYNLSSHRAGFPLQPFFEEYLAWLKEPNNWLGYRVPFPPKQFVQQARVLSSGRRQTRQNEDHFVDRTVLQLSIFPNTFKSHWNYRVNIKYKSKKDVLVVKCKLLHEVISRIEITSDGRASISLLVPANTYLGPIVLAEKIQPILDPREIPQILFSNIQKAVQLKDEIYQNIIRTLNEKVDLISYLGFLQNIYRKIKRSDFLDHYLINYHPFQITERELRTLDYPESGTPQFSKIRARVAADRKHSYAYELELRYNDIIEESSANIQRANHLSDKTQTAYFDTPEAVAKTVQQQLTQRFAEYSPFWKCYAEVEDFDGIAIDVTLHCRTKLNPQFLIRLIQNY